MVARLENEDGKMNIYMNNIPTPPILFALSDFPAAASNTHYAFKNIQNFKSQGINIVSADSDLNVGWHKVSPFDSEAITSEIESVLDANPDAKVLLRFLIRCGEADVVRIKVRAAVTFSAVGVAAGCEGCHNSQCYNFYSKVQPSIYRFWLSHLSANYQGKTDLVQYFSFFILRPFKLT